METVNQKLTLWEAMSGLVSDMARIFMDSLPCRQDAKLAFIKLTFCNPN